MKNININEYIIRQMEESDWDEVSRIYLEGIATNLATFETKCPTYEKWDKEHLIKCRKVICNGDDIFGWIALSPTSNRKAYEGVAALSIYIDSKFKNMGVGEKLLRFIIECAEKENIWTLQSSIMEDNLSSIRLHEKCGFRKVGYREKIACDRYGNWRDNVIFEFRSKLLY